MAEERARQNRKCQHKLRVHLAEKSDVALWNGGPVLLQRLKVAVHDDASKHYHGAYAIGAKRKALVNIL